MGFLSQQKMSTFWSLAGAWYGAWIPVFPPPTPPHLWSHCILDSSTSGSIDVLWSLTVLIAACCPSLSTTPAPPRVNGRWLHIWFELLSPIVSVFTYIATSIVLLQCCMAMLIAFLSVKFLALWYDPCAARTSTYWLWPSCMGQEAFKNYLKTRDYSTTSKHMMQMCLNAMKVSLEMKNYIHMHNHLRKAEQLPDVQVHQKTRPGHLQRRAVLHRVWGTEQDVHVYIMVFCRLRSVPSVLCSADKRESRPADGIYDK